MIRAYDEYGDIVDLVEWEKRIRDKAIDDFAELLRGTRDNRTLRVNCDDLEIRHMVERLKAGDGE